MLLNESINCFQLWESIFGPKSSGRIGHPEWKVNMRKAFQQRPEWSRVFIIITWLWWSIRLSFSRGFKFINQRWVNVLVESVQSVVGSTSSIIITMILIITDKPRCQRRWMEKPVTTTVFLSSFSHSIKGVTKKDSVHRNFVWWNWEAGYLFLCTLVRIKVYRSFTSVRRTLRKFFFQDSFEILFRKNGVTWNLYRTYSVNLLSANTGIGSTCVSFVCFLSDVGDKVANCDWLDLSFTLPSPLLQPSIHPLDTNIQFNWIHSINTLSVLSYTVSSGLRKGTRLYKLWWLIIKGLMAMIHLAAAVAVHPKWFQGCSIS